jgi:hypothetical protein
VFPVIGTLANAGTLWACKTPEERLRLAEELRTIGLGLLFAGNIPLVVMAIGIVSGQVATSWHYLRPQEGNFYVIGWYTLNLLIWTWGFWWVLRKGGGEALARAFLCEGRELSSVVLVRSAYCLPLVATIVAVMLVDILDFPITRR